VAQRIPCPHCGAAAGAPCDTATGALVCSERAGPRHERETCDRCGRTQTSLVHANQFDIKYQGFPLVCGESVESGAIHVHLICRNCLKAVPDTEIPEPAEFDDGWDEVLVYCVATPEGLVAAKCDPVGLVRWARVPLEPRP
jgi:hypothetical protein